MKFFIYTCTELHSLYSSPNNFSIIKSRRRRLVMVCSMSTSDERCIQSFWLENLTRTDQ
jgi:hypothetical protein